MKISNRTIHMWTLFSSILTGFLLGKAVLSIIHGHQTKTCGNEQGRTTTSNFLLVSVTLNHNQAFQNDNQMSIIKKTWGADLSSFNSKSTLGKIVFFDKKDKEGDLKYFANQDVILFNQTKKRPDLINKFLILNHIKENYLDRFKWFMLVNHETYVNIDKLTKMLTTMDSNKDIYMGRPQLVQYKTSDSKVRQMDVFCEEGNGIIISNLLLRKIVSIHDCLQNLITFEYGVELGRCIKKYAGIECTKAQETTDQFFRRSQDFNEGVVGQLEGKNPLPTIPEIKTNFIDKLTYYPIPHDKYLVKLHIIMLKQQIKDRFKKMHSINQEITSSSPHNSMQQYNFNSSNKATEDLWLSPIVANRVFTLDSSFTLKQMPSKWKTTLKTVKKLMYKSFEMDFESKQTISVKGVYYKLSPSKELEFLGQYTQYENVKQEHTKVLKTRKIFYKPMMQEYDVDIQERIKGKQDIETEVVFIATVSGREEIIKRFCKDFEKTFFAEKDFNVRIIFVNFLGSSEKQMKEESNIKQMLQEFSVKHGSDMVTTITMLDDHFSRGKGLQEGINSIENGDPIMFLCDIDLHITEDLLLRIRKNTIKGKRAYYPTFLSQFDPEILEKATDKQMEGKDYEQNVGFWRHFSFGMASVYMSDFKRTKGFNLSIEGWGLEDIQFCQAIITQAKLDIFKSPDRALTHIYHDKECTGLTGSQLSMCQSTKFSHYGSQETLSKYWQNQHTNKKKRFLVA